MTNLISLTTLLCLLLSCNQNSKSIEDKSLGLSTGALQNKTAVIDTTQINIDGVKVSPENFKILSENKIVRVVEYSLMPGKKDNWHTHPSKSGYVVSGGTLKIYPENAEAFISEEKTGETFWSDYVGKHYVENVGNTKVIIILTEIKSLE